MTNIRSPIPGFEVPLHRALSEPILLAGAPRNVTIINATLAASIGLGLQLWIAGIAIWVFAHLVAVWATKKDAAFMEVLSRHMQHKGFLTC